MIFTDNSLPKGKKKQKKNQQPNQTFNVIKSWYVKEKTSS